MKTEKPKYKAGHSDRWPKLQPVSDTERRIWMPPPRPGILEHTRATFILPEKTSRISGPWSDDYTPFIRRPMQLLEQPPVRVWISASPQSGKSTLSGILFSYIVQCCAGPTGIVLPQEQLAKDRISTKWRQLFEKNPDLLRRLGGDVRNLHVGEPTDLGDMILFLCWATSIATLSDRSIQNMIYDEVVLFEIEKSMGVNPIESGRERQETFKAISRELGISTPGDEGDLHDEQMRAGSDEVWCVPCVKRGCGRWHQLQTYVDKADEKYIVLDRPAPGRYYHPDEYENNPKLSRYVCPHCGKAWSDADRWRSNREGKYISAKRAVDDTGERTGPPRQTMDENGTVTGPEPDGPQYSFTWNAMMLYPPYSPVHKLAAEFVKARKKSKAGDKSLMRKWVRSRQAKPFKEVGRTVDATRLETEKKNSYPMGVVPSWVKVLTAGADYHKDEMGNERVDYEIRGWGDDLRNCKIVHGHAGSLEAMFRATTTQSFPWAEKTETPELMLACGFVDARYQPEDPDDRTAYVVYDFCKKYYRLGVWIPIMGGRPNQVERFVIKDLERAVQESGKKYRNKYAKRYRGMKLIIVAVSQFKDLVTAMAEAPMDAPGSTSFAVDTPADYFREFSNEHKVKNKKTARWEWVVKKDGLPTHGLDVSVYATAAGYFKKVDTMWSEEELQKIRQAQTARGIGGRKVRLSEKPRRRI